jgi:motility quorum-sensing regulator/GCU-specific mRNA interferase toxin
MASEKVPGLWQDVYRVPDDDLTLYVKFTSDTVTEFKLLSFKEK